MEDKYFVYIHTNKINNKKDIGITKTSLKKRWGSNGKQYLVKNKDGSYKQPSFARAIVKYGWDNFAHDIFSSDLDKDKANELEIYLISILRTNDKRYGYNIQQGGQTGNAGRVFSEESKEKMRAAKIGKHLTEEHKKKISDGCKGHKPGILSDEGRESLRRANTGKVLTEETKNKISKALSGITRSDDTRQKMSDNHANKRPVFCPELNEAFETLTAVYKKYGIHHANIEKCIKGERKSAGKHPITGEKLTWVELKKII